MISALRLTLLIALAALLGCGVTPPNQPNPTTFDLNGDWLALAPSPAGTQTIPTPIAEFAGALQFNGSAVTGTVHALSVVFPNPCIYVTQDLPVTGTLDATNHLVLTVPISGGTATITAAVGDTYTYFNNGTWQIVGGTCAMPSTQITMAHFAPITGTYTGTFNVLNLTTLAIEPGTATAITATLTQSTTPDADGQFPIAGTITATGACTGTFPVDEIVSGGAIKPGMGAPATIFDGASEPTATYLVTAFTSLNACGSLDYSGTLTRK